MKKQHQKTPELYLGIREGDLDGKWYAKYYNPHMQPLPGHIKEALTLGVQPPPLCLELSDAPSLAEAGYHTMENGYTALDDGSLYVAGLTRMPKVSPEMWDWWFSWHPTETQRYKLWNPPAHLHSERVGPSAGGSGSYRDIYVGSTALIQEYVGNSRGAMAIKFLPPSQLGYDEKQLADPTQATAICCRISLSQHPLEWGWMVHYVRRTDEGAEMRSRIWVGGQYVKATVDESALSDEAKAVRERITHMVSEQGRNMLVGHAQEMYHLAEFLPYIYGEFQLRTSLNL